MKIAHVTHSFPPYEAGTGRVCYFNALELGRLGHDVTVFTPNYPKGSYDYPAEFKVKRLPTPLRLGNAPLMPSLLTELKGFDLIHLHYPFIFGAELTWLASKLYNIPYVLTHHNDLLTEGQNIRQLLFKLYYPLTKQITAQGAKKWVVVSKDHAAHCQLTPIFEQRWADVREVSNGVDLSVFRPISTTSIRQKYEIAEDKFLILFVGALDSAHLFKGVNRLIAAVACLPASKVQLMIVGDGDMKAAYTAMAEEAGILENCTFVGKVAHEDLAPYYSAAQVLVLPSLAPESFGMVLIEAGACQTAVIASDIAGVRSVVQHEIDGFLVEAGNIEALVQKLRLLLENPALCQQMGQNGYQKVVEKYAWDKLGKVLADVYQELLEGN